ncbi:MAG: hypothetical protein SPK00_05430 [Corynebacterium glucuronolyticum]|nr:hypothetical protein [Corynebacterium glucuronolyticum]MDD7586172.1 hypothetical protein [Mycobacteriaceae bacterium]MDY5834175.1 hypothetical protein [Corynebacterium glucuronolyticum]
MAHPLTKTALPAGIYVRISLDEHDCAGVERQEQACHLVYVNGGEQALDM